jgi:DNA polymerase I-like protein with 3'-5' exonuclease and polymerase domains
MQRMGLWNSFERQVVGLEPVLCDMSLRGMPVDPVIYAEVLALLKTDMALAKKEMQALVPPELRKVKVYKKTPKRVTEAHFQADVTTADGVGKKEWRQWLPWTPSNQALVGYMKHKNHPVPKDFKGDKDTTNKMELARLYNSTKDPMYKKVLGYRKAQTVITNHMKNWLPGEDERVHSTFYFDPATGQLSSRRPNVQNAPKRDDPEFGGYAKAFRSMVKAKPGHTILELDFKSFHAQTLAFEAEDADYLRLAKIDIHSYLAARLVRESRFSQCLSWPDAELAEYLRWIKKNHKFVRDEKAKRAILGYGFGMGAKKLYQMNRESFDSQRDAKLVLDTLDGCFPVCKAWRTAIKLKAHEQGYLISRYAYIRYFWEVMQWRGGEWRPGGDDAEAAIAFLPANSAFGEMRTKMLEIKRLGLDSRFNLINNVHDSLVFECPTELIGQAGEIKAIMESASTTLINSICPNGLSVEVDVQIGPDWGNMKETKL